MHQLLQLTAWPRFAAWKRLAKEPTGVHELCHLQGISILVEHALLLLSDLWCAWYDLYICMLYQICEQCGCAGTWQQYVLVHVDNLFPVRPEVSNEDASQYFVNPCTGEELRRTGCTHCIGVIKDGVPSGYMVFLAQLTPCSGVGSASSCWSCMWRIAACTSLQWAPPKNAEASKKLSPVVQLWGLWTS